nr:hypothetical protein [Tanacetum cinerariifolium]
MEAIDIHILFIFSIVPCCLAKLCQTFSNWDEVSTYFLAYEAIKLLSTPKKVYNRKLSYTKQSGSSEYCTWIGTFTLTVDPMSTPETTPADRWIYPSNTVLKMLSPTKSPQDSHRLLL